MTENKPLNVLSSASDILEIEREIEHYEQIVIDLKLRRNSHLPMFKVPVEILCRIFGIIQDSYAFPMVQKRHTPLSLSEGLGWIAVTHVCHHWRNVALNNPSLWTEPPLRHSKWTAIMLERSRMAGLRIVIDQRPRINEQVLSSVIAHIPRTTEIIIQDADKLALEKLFTDLRTTVAPMLHKLEINGRVYRDKSVNPVHKSYPRLHEDTFIGATNLRHLSLTRVEIDWSSHLVSSSLTSLSIKDVSNGARPTAAAFLGILKRMPRLKFLTLHQVLPSYDRLVSIGDVAYPRVPLPALESLSIISEVTGGEFLLNHISTSASLNNIDVSITCQSSSGPITPRLLSAIDDANLYHHLKRDPRSVYLSGLITDGGASWLTVCTSNHLSSSLVKDRTPSRHRRSNGSDFTLNVEVHNLSASPMYINQPNDLPLLADFFNGMRWDRLLELDISHLRVSTNVGGLSTTLATTFGTLPRLQALMVGPVCAKPLVDALLINSDEDPSASPNSIVFPGLRYIELHGVSFDKRYDPEAMEIGRLQDCFMNRYERGVEVYSVLVELCPQFTNAMYQILKGIVVDVSCTR